jgi:hypothetical protein
VIQREEKWILSPKNNTEQAKLDGYDVHAKKSVMDMGLMPNYDTCNQSYVWFTVYWMILPRLRMPDSTDSYQYSYKISFDSSMSRYSNVINIEYLTT